MVCSGTEYCYTANYTVNGVVVFARGCDGDRGSTFCPDADKTCRSLTKKNNLTSCAGVCCTTDNCNNYTPSSADYTTTPSSANDTTTPSSADGVIVTKSILCLMAIAGFIFA